MKLSDFHFTLPQEFIAKYPLPTRTESKLMHVKRETRTHYHFHDILQFINPGDLLVFNDTKVIPARLFGKKSTGGAIEILVERILNRECMRAQVHANKSIRVGDLIFFKNNIQLEVIARQNHFYDLRFANAKQTILELIESIGEIPLPPYMHRAPDENDNSRYQTVYAANKGAIAAPTAGFHFDEILLQQLREKNVNFAYLTLHIGAGTFAPVRVDNVFDHKMHAEYVQVSANLCKQIEETKSNGKRVIAVGTTSLRALETAYQNGKLNAYDGDTTIFIYPGHTFHSADALITNLHLPSSTLMMLVCAFGGYEHVMQAYAEAVQKQYRFYSYGDAMWIERNQYTR